MLDTLMFVMMNMIARDAHSVAPGGDFLGPLRMGVEAAFWWGVVLPGLQVEGCRSDSRDGRFGDLVQTLGGGEGLTD